LEIDPTFTSNSYSLWATANHYTDTVNGAWSNDFYFWENSVGDYTLGAEFDLSSLTNVVVTGATFSGETRGDGSFTSSSSAYCDVVSMTNSPQSYLATLDYQGMINDVYGTQTVYISESGACEPSSTGSYNSFTDTFNSAGVTAIQDSITNGNNFWWGYKAVGSLSSGQGSYGADNLPVFTITYTVPIAPQPPTGLTTVTGIPIELDWTAPTDNGGSAITGYKVYRTLNEFALSELPNNSGSDSQITFTDNEFLLHGFETTPATTTTFESDFSSSTNWSQVGNDVVVTGGQLDLNIPNTTNQEDSISYDLGTVSNDSWVLRFTMDLDNFSVNTAGSAKKLVFGISDSPASTPIPSSQTAIGGLFGTWDSGTTVRTRDNVNGNWMDGAGTNLSETFNSGGVYYVELIRICILTVLILLLLNLNLKLYLD
jgi:hypothetical protein